MARRWLESLRTVYKTRPPWQAPVIGAKLGRNKFKKKWKNARRSSSSKLFVCTPSHQAAPFLSRATAISAFFNHAPLPVPFTRRSRYTHNPRAPLSSPPRRFRQLVLFIFHHFRNGERKDKTSLPREGRRKRRERVSCLGPMQNENAEKNRLWKRKDGGNKRSRGEVTDCHSVISSVGGVMWLARSVIAAVALQTAPRGTAA